MVVDLWVVVDLWLLDNEGKIFLDVGWGLIRGKGELGDG